MNWMKFRTLFAVIALSVSLFAACQEDTNNPVNPGKDKPAAVTNLRANSASETSIRLNWDKSKSDTSSLFKGYKITIAGGGPMSPIEVGGLAMPYTVTGLELGIEYTFQVSTVFTDGTESDPVSIKWSPAWVFYNYASDKEIRLYGSSSSLGSGIDFFNSSNKAENLNISQGAEWDLGFYDKSGMLLIGSPSKLEYNWGSVTPKVVEIAVLDATKDYTDLSQIYDSQALNNSALSFSERTINLNDYKNSNVALVVRVPAGAGKYNYAKVLVLRGTNGQYVQQEGSNDYVHIQVAYQPTVNMPYAKVAVK